MSEGEVEEPPAREADWASKESTLFFNYNIFIKSVVLSAISLQGLTRCSTAVLTDSVCGFTGKHFTPDSVSGLREREGQT